MHRNFDVYFLMLGIIPIQISNSVRNLEFVFDNQLSLDGKIDNAMRKVIDNLINVSRITKFIDKDSKMKLVHGLVFSIIHFRNSLYYGLPHISSMGSKC